MTLDFSKARLPPFAHQREDTQTAIDHPYLFITSEMRTGKTKIVIDAAQFLFERGLIDRVIVVAPEPVRGVWYDPETGELQKHLWNDTPAWITEYHSRVRQWRWGPAIADKDAKPLKWIITNFEFIRAYTDKHGKRIDAALRGLLPYVNNKTLLVLDESSAITNHKSEQFKACLVLRRKCSRVILLNGTPMDTPIHLFAQGNMLHPSILDCGYITHFRARYAQMGGFKVGAVRVKKPDGSIVFEGGRPTQVIGWINLDDLQRRFAPVTIRRLQKDCVDMPEKLDPITIPVTMTPETWSYYVEMRDQMVVMLEGGNASIAQQAITKIMRLAQITSGFLGGIADAGLEDDVVQTASVREIGREKLDMMLWLTQMQLEKDPHIKLVTWVRFRPELDRMLKVVAKKFPQMIVSGMHGGQKKSDRRDALHLLKPETAPADKAVFFAGTYGTGSFGLDFSASYTNINCSYDYSLRKFLQSGDRVYGPGQKHPVSYYDLVAQGPRGQKTIDHIILSDRRGKADVANWVTSDWVRALKEE